MALTPMMRQYLSVKEEFPDALLFYRIGDFYEMFFEDAETGSRELELVLTGRDCGLEKRAPMCGIPYHAAETYIRRLVDKGYKVAICEQLTDPKEARPLVERGVIRVVTPGTVIEQSMLDEKQNNFLLAVKLEGSKAGVAYADVSTGECMAMEISGGLPQVSCELTRIEPREIIADADSFSALSALKYPTPMSSYASPAWKYTAAKKRVLEHFHAQTLAAFDLEGQKLAVSAAGALLEYINDTQRNAMQHLRTLRRVYTGQYMVLDATARRNLELVRTLRGTTGRGTLLGLIDKTVTAMGGRLLHAWVEQPLGTKEAIEARLSCVEELLSSPMRMHDLTETLREVRDVERIVGKIAYNALNPQHCLALGNSFSCVPKIQQLLSECRSDALCALREKLDPLTDISERIEKMIDPDAPSLMGEGGFILSGYSAELDDLRAAAKNGKDWISAMEQREREETGIKTLKIPYNKIFGYCIEVTKSYYSLVPLRYVRRQTLANCERYTTPELQEMEKQILGASERSIHLEAQLFAELKQTLSEAIPRMQQTAEALKTLDALLSLAKVADENRYVRPEITEDGAIEIINGRHPVVEQMLHDDSFVPNDTEMDRQEKRMLIITGPNMAGKSTYMRQVALIVLMAHLGSFVPADSAKISLTDRIFTRIGASDDLAGGQSTFLVEMSETAQILRNATPNSLIILDEIGRGTSTFDGLSIAWAVVEHIVSKCGGAKALFATHYHELSELEGRLDGVVNYRIAVKERGEDVIFLRRIERGGADKSFGIHVARLAGVPRPVVARAQEILARLETANVSQSSISANILETNRKQKQMQVGFGDFRALDLVEELRALDVNSMTPMDALNALFQLREKARNI